MSSERKIKSENIIICPICHKVNEPNSESCSSCSVDFSGMTVCPSCFYEQSVKKNLCKKCNHPLKNKVKFYSKKPALNSPILYEQEKSSLSLIIFITLPVIAFTILIHTSNPRIQFPALAIIIASTFFLLRRAYKR